MLSLSSILRRLLGSTALGSQNGVKPGEPETLGRLQRHPDEWGPVIKSAGIKAN